MNKKIIVLSLLLFTITPLFSQNFENWRFVRTIGPQIVGCDLTITPDGCIWIASIDSNWIGRIIILNSYGTPKDTITTVDFQNTNYDFYSPPIAIGTDYNGNVLFSARDILYKIDYKTYKCLQIIEEQEQRTKAVSDFHGNILIGYWVDGLEHPFRTFSDSEASIQLIKTVLETNTNFAIYIAMTPDGTTLYIATRSPFTNEPGFRGVAKYYSPTTGIWGPYTHVKDMGQSDKSSNTVYLDSKGRLWVGYYGINRPSGYDCYDVQSEEIVGGFTSVAGATTSAQGAIIYPTGIVFSLDGSKAYTLNDNVNYTENPQVTYVQEWEVVPMTDATQPKAIPEGFTLSQNYPNPFNPSTNFSYSIPNKTNVRIAVYDLFGREIKTLVNKNKDAGIYNITWNGKDNNSRQVSTGVYFYKMQAGDFQKTMKMMLMK